MRQLSILAALLLANAALAQATNPIVTWEVSTDLGATWSQSVTITNSSPGTVKVRGTLSWTQTSGQGTAFAAVSFDGSITGALAETGNHIQKPLQQSLGATPGSVANIGNGTVRFSAFTDAGLPGDNTDWWIIGQDGDLVTNGDHSFPGINRANPVQFLYFDLNIDRSADHDMSVSCIFNPIAGRAAIVFLEGPDGGFGMRSSFSRSDMVVRNATIHVAVPAASTTMTIAIASLFATSRRRRH